MLEQMNNQVAKNELRLFFNIPNVITGFRVVLSIIIAILLLQSKFLTAGVILVVAASTDWLDGFISRRLKQSSLCGSLFDLIADELLFMPNLILAIHSGLFNKADSLMPGNPYPYAIPALAGGTAVLSGVSIYIWKRRKRMIVFPTPTGIAKVNFWFWLTPLVLAVFNFGPGWLLAGLMYLAIISTILTFYSYLKKGSYVFTD